MPGQYIGILVLVILSAIISGVMVVGSWLLGPKKTTVYKSSPYECGVTPEGSARERFPIQFYLVAIMFILFDIEVVFLWSWMTVFKNSDQAFKTFSYSEVVLYMVTWVLGYLYMLRVGAMNWDGGMIGDKMLHDEQVAEEAKTAALEPVGAR